MIDLGKNLYIKKYDFIYSYNIILYKGNRYKVNS